MAENPRWAPLVRALLLLYPPAFRERFGEEMAAAYGEQLRAARRAGPGRTAVLRTRTVVGMVRGAWTEWRSSAAHGGAGTTRDGGREMGEWGREVGQAARRLRRAPGFSAVTVLTLAVGVGAFSSVWTVAESVLLEPMPYDEPEELVWVWRDYTTCCFDLRRGWLGGPDIVSLREQEAFEAVVATQNQRMNLSGAAGLEPRDVRATVASANLFDVLGVRPALGRGFEPGEDEPGAVPSAVLSHDLWRGAFGGDPGILGSSIYLNGDAATVVGVLPDGFDFVVHSSLGDPNPADLYLPLQEDLASVNPGAGFLAGLARVRDGAAPAEVEAATAAAAQEVGELLGVEGFRLWATPLKEDLVAGIRRPLFAVVAAAGFLVLTLAANLATLFLARASAREHDVAVRKALGAGRSSLVRTVVVETLLLATVGGLLGIAVGAQLSGLLARAASSILPRATEIGLDASGALVALALGVALGLVAAAAPIGRVLGSRTARTLREGGARSGGSVSSSRSRAGLVVAQVALSMVLLVGAGLLGRTVSALLRVDPGFDPGSTLTFRIALDEGGYEGAEEILAFHERLRERIGALPSVEAVGITNVLPLGADASQTTARFPGAPGNTGEDAADAPLADVLSMDAGYLEAGGLRLLEGRNVRLGGAEEDTPAEVLIDDVLARRFFPGGSAVGARITNVVQDTGVVVGVVDQARLYDVNRDDRGQVLVPMDRRPARSVYVTVRSVGDPLRLAPALREAVRAEDARLPVSEVSTLDAKVREALGDERMSLALVGSFAAGALLLTWLGLYGVVAGTVVQRRGEIGLRMAIGAERGSVVRMVLAQGGRLVLWGLILGTVAAWGAARLLSTLLYGVSAFDAPTYLAVALALGGVSLLASWLPARAASRIPPTEALRAE